MTPCLHQRRTLPFIKNNDLFKTIQSCINVYSEEPKSVTAFDLFTFFHADINQSEVEDSFQLDSDWIKSA